MYTVPLYSIEYLETRKLQVFVATTWQESTNTSLHLFLTRPEVSEDLGFAEHLTINQLNWN